jgi:uncharacterized protein YaiI (UPF0178 family)
MTIIYIDADACPVKDETLRVAERHKLKVRVVSNGGIRPNPHPLVETVVVGHGADVADQWIADRTGTGDICVTGDIQLALRCIDAGAQAINHNGELFSKSNIGQRMAMRDLMADIRAANPLAAGGSGKSFSKADRSRFLNGLELLIQRAKRIVPGVAG